jgi:hypothetical protein
MTDLLCGTVIFLLRAIDFVLEIFVTIDRLKRFARLVTGSDKLVQVPADPKPLPAAARRALAEAEARRAASP